MTAAQRRLVADVVAHVERVQRAVILDALAEATSSYWHRRAETFRWAQPDPERDFPGQATLDELRARWVELEGIAEACDHRAEVSLIARADERVADLLLTPTEIAALATAADEYDSVGVEGLVA